MSNNISKLLLIGTCLALATGNHAAKKTQDEMVKEITIAQRTLVSNHTLAFSKANLILGYITQEESAAWDAAIASVKNVIQDYAPTNLLKDGTQLTTYAIQIKDALRTIFEKQIRPALTTKKAQTAGVSANAITQKIDYNTLPIDTTKLNMQSLDNMVNLIKSLRAPITAIETSVANNCKIQKGKSAQPVQAAICNLLNTFAAYLDTTIVAITNHAATFKKEIVNAQEPESVRWHEEK